MRIFYTGDLVTNDGSDTDGYGEPCEPGHGYEITNGWVDMTWSKNTVYENQDDVSADEWTPADGPMIDWAIRTIHERIGFVETETANYGTLYAREPNNDVFGAWGISYAAHIYDASESVVSAIVSGLAFVQKQFFANHRAPNPYLDGSDAFDLVDTGHLYR